ncbi:UDP-N-acetylenolpyruvoylglucosamine reductase [Candidatus Gottesmanbacteria bacterium RBG_13_45_10]|uniref:UDP-N-acetylenolpyruvoylglucosamine reductase n=1 Tax=Candidatus Gottesmanbacteria bacterium RBG_13_45_10 TaxID=1798370 RepID=A0A1F5ZG22_9BACT|nr:MAG: UDP-N-acetylenolpyruvoylglucosamine reductase [Candidatus Gottesmanbacteria bacterium RBG_13_45_10]
MESMYQKLKLLIGEEIKEQEPLASYTTLKIGGPADFFFDAKTTEQLVTAVKGAHSLGIPLFLLGSGTNILIGDKGIRGLVIKNSTSVIRMRGMKGRMSGGSTHGFIYVEADSGVFFNKLVRFTIEEGLAGIEMHLGLPGSVGGAVYMNSKWTHPEGYVGDVVYQAEILSSKDERKVVPRSYFQFAYDTSVIQKTRDIVMRVTFAFVADNKEHLWQVANESIAYRRQSQPQGVKSAGCTFRNISKAQALTLATPEYTTSAGFLVDHAGLKGETIGDAQISPIHANFIINNGHATASDVIQLIERARERVKHQFGIELKEEIIRVGEF